MRIEGLWDSCNKLLWCTLS